TIGILGGGQLGRMTAMAARTLGYHVHVLDPDGDCAASGVADRVIAAKFDDADAAADLARQCDVVTLEIEQIGVDALAAAERHAPVRPRPHILAVVQDRAMQKRWLADHNFPIGPHRVVDSASALADAARALGPLFVKACRGGYDGRSQARVAAPGEAEATWASLGGRTSVAEQALDLDAELSVMVARRPSGETRVDPPALNHHERQILSWSVIPAPLPERTLRDAEEIARGIAAAFELEGILAVELFLLRDGTLLVNELAPRPHNSFHETEVACSTTSGCAEIQPSRRRCPAPEFGCICTASAAHGRAARWAISRLSAERPTRRWPASATRRPRSPHRPERIHLFKIANVSSLLIAAAVAACAAPAPGPVAYPSPSPAAPAAPV